MGNELTGNGGDDTIDGAGGIDVAILVVTKPPIRLLVQRVRRQFRY